MNELRISALQFNIAWENKSKNLLYVEKQLKSIAGTTDLVVLPEMFTTGFSMNSRQLAEPISGETMNCVRRWSASFGCAIAGSFIAEENGSFYNRGFFITPDGNEFFYNKHHLFRMGDEGKSFLPGNEPLIVSYQGWNIRLLICYDLRFPVWARNVNNNYDLLIYTANWPASRSHIWKTLLAARAIENMAYVCGVNRVGGATDNIFEYAGNSQILDARGRIMATAKDIKEQFCSATLNLKELQDLRQKFPAWRDADLFTILPPDSKLKPE